MSMLPEALRDFAHCDVYLLDQIFKQRIRAGMRVLDVGCGDGRNARALLAVGCQMTLLDPDPGAIERCRRSFGSHEQIEDRVCSSITAYSGPADFDVVICNAVLHFAPDQQSWRRWADACWAQLGPGGLFFARLSTRLVLPDASPPGFGYLADSACINDCETQWQAQRVDPFKSTAVEEQRCMSTWVLQKT